MNIELRELQLEDAEFMLEFYSQEYARYFRFSSLNPQDEIQSFIKNSWNDKNNKHYAITVNKEYAGTISLKKIDLYSLNAEYAIVLRKKFWGMNIASDATHEIIGIAFSELKLIKIYLNVLSTNKRAINFYVKFGFVKEGTLKKHICIDRIFYDLDLFAYLNERTDEL